MDKDASTDLYWVMSTTHLGDKEVASPDNSECVH